MSDLSRLLPLSGREFSRLTCWNFYLDTFLIPLAIFLRISLHSEHSITAIIIKSFAVSDLSRPLPSYLDTFLIPLAIFLRISLHSEHSITAIIIKSFAVLRPVPALCLHISIRSSFRSLYFYESLFIRNTR